MQGRVWAFDIIVLNYDRHYLKELFNKLRSAFHAQFLLLINYFDNVMTNVIVIISDTLKELHWLPVEQRIIFKINVICFKIVSNLIPYYLVDLIHVYEDHHHHHHRHHHHHYYYYYCLNKPNDVFEVQIV